MTVDAMSDPAGNEVGRWFAVKDATWLGSRLTSAEVSGEGDR